MINFFDNLSDPSLIELLCRGAIGVLPTDTVYGLVSSMAVPEAISRQYKVKDRPSHPGTMIASSIEQLLALGFRSTDIARASNYWPGPVSVVLDASNIDQSIKDDKTGLAVRIPDSMSLLSLLDKTGPLMTTSANHHNAPSAVTIEQAREYFGDSIDFYVDRGDLSDRPSSTIIGFDTSGQVVVYRQGAVEINAKKPIFC